MRVCPKCGHIDRSSWRQNRWRTNVEFVELSEFDFLKPNLAKKLLEGHPFATDKLYAYRLSGKTKRVVERVYIKDFEVGGKTAFHIPRERVVHPRDFYQRKLVEGE